MVRTSKVVGAVLAWLAIPAVITLWGLHQLVGVQPSSGGLIWFRRDVAFAVLGLTVAIALCVESLVYALITSWRSPAKLLHHDDGGW